MRRTDIPGEVWFVEDKHDRAQTHACAVCARSQHIIMATTDAQSRRRWGGPAAQTAATGASRTRSRALVLSQGEWLRSLFVFVVAGILLLAADITALWLHPGTYTVDIGNYRDFLFLKDAHKQEEEFGETYRWTRANSMLWLTQVDVGPHALLTLDLGGRPQPGETQLTFNGQPWVELTARSDARHYTLLLPPDASGDLEIGLASPTFNTEIDPRNLGIKIDSFALTVPATGPPWPTAMHYLSQLGIILAAQLIAIRLGWRWRIQALLAGLLVVALAAILGGMLLLASLYLQRLAIIGGVLALLTWALLPIAERHLTWMGGIREVRLLWAIMLLVCMLRFVGVFYPTFGAQDLGRNINRLLMSIRGNLVIIAWSGEFADGDTIYPPGPYLAIMPGLTLTDDYGALMQGSLALLDGSTAFMVALLAWRLGGNRETARLAMLLYASNIAVFGAMTYGFSAQIFGQWFTAPLALLLLAPNGLARPRTWALALTLLLIAVLSHIGVAILGVTWISAILGLMFLAGQRHRGFWWGVGLFGASLLLAFSLLYIHIFETTVTHLAQVAQERGQTNFQLRGNTPLLWKGLRLAYSVAGLLLLPLGLALIFRARPDLERLLVPLAWVLTTLLFFLVDLATALQVRYFYYSLPLASVAIAMVPGYLAERGRWGRPVAWALVLAIAIPNILLWYSATFADGKISMTPLTH